MDCARPVTPTIFFKNFPGGIIHSFNFSHSPAVKQLRDTFAAHGCPVDTSYFFYSGNLQNSAAFINFMM